MWSATCGGSLHDWQRDSDAEAAVGGSVRRERAAVAFDDRPRNRETQTGAAGAAISRAVDAEEPLGEPRQIFLGHPRSAVLPVDGHAPVVAARTHHDLPRRRRVAQIILNKVSENL